jgi:hypothetical protein
MVMITFTVCGHLLASHMKKIPISGMNRRSRIVEIVLTTEVPLLAVLTAGEATDDAESVIASIGSLA